MQEQSEEQNRRTSQPDSSSSEAEKVLCFVSKKEVDRSSARQIEHPKEGLVWVSEQYIK